MKQKMTLLVLLLFALTLSQAAFASSTNPDLALVRFEKTHEAKPAKPEDQAGPTVCCKTSQESATPSARC